MDKKLSDLRSKQINKSSLKTLGSLALILIVLAIFTFFPFRIDLTEDGRYSLSPYTKELIKRIDQPIQAQLYLNGDLNPAFHRLRQATIDLIADMSKISKQKINISYVNPAAADSEEKRMANYSSLIEQGLQATEVYMRDKEGKSMRKVLFPWLSLHMGERQINIPLLKNLHDKSGEENINISIENLEFEIADALRRLTDTSVTKIAFLEGHGELDEAATYAITKSLSRYYQIDRGELQHDASVLFDYPLVIIAGPQEAFSESDKYILDQYLMYGGSILWLIDGVQYDRQQLASTGNSPVIPTDFNLEDIFFKYGIKIHPVLVRDLQAVEIPVNIAPAGENPQFDYFPWYYSPLLLTSDYHPIAKNTGEIWSEFVSYISPTAQLKDLDVDVLLASSHQSDIVNTPAIVAFSDMQHIDPSEFQASFLPIAVMLSGNFQSNYVNRMKPAEVISHLAFKAKSEYTRQIFVAGSSIIRNETSGIASDSTTLPLGYDRNADIIHGNEKFLINAIHFLAHRENLIALRAKSIKIRLLNKQLSVAKKTRLQILNLVFPIFLLLIFAGVFYYSRKVKYKTPQK